jgi:hypothetical protein
VQLVIDAAVLEDPKAKNYTPQQPMGLSFLGESDRALEP